MKTEKQTEAEGKFEKIFARLVVIFLFGLLPFLYDRNLYDPELSIRFIGLAVLIGVLSLFFILKKKSSALFFDRNFFGENKIQFAFFFLIAGVSVLKAYDTGAALYDWLRLCLLFLFFVLWVLLVKQNQKLRDDVNAGVGVAVIIFSVFGAMDLYDPVMRALNGGRHLQMEYYFASTLGNKNFYAETLFMCLPFLLDGWWRFSGAKKYLMAASFLLATGSILILQSFSVFVALLFSTALFFFLFRKYIRKTGAIKINFTKRKMILASVILAVVLAVSGWYLVRSGNFEALKFKFTSFGKYLTEDSSLQNSKQIYGSFTERFVLWQHTLKMSADHPVFGCGISNWKTLYPGYGNFGIEFMDMGTLKLEHPHNDYLLFLSEQGLIGLLAWLSIFFFVFQSAFRQLNFSESSEEKIRIILTICGVSGFMILSLFGFPVQRFYQMILLLMLFALVIANERKEKAETEKFFLSNKILFVFALLISIYSSWFFMKRYEGEIHFRRALHEQLNKNWSAMSNEISFAKSFPFQSDLLATPLDWYSGFAAFYSGDEANAKIFFEKAVIQNPFHVQSWNDLATCYEHQKNYQQAIACYNRALSINHSFYNSRLNLTAAYFNSGKVEEAYKNILLIPFSKGDKQYRTFLFAVLQSRLNTILQTQADEELKKRFSKKLANKNYLLKLFKQSLTTSKNIDSLFISQLKK